jgi:protein-tyrosine phosphatase
VNVYVRFELVVWRRQQLNRDTFYGLSFSLIALAIAKSALHGGWYISFAWPAMSFGIVAAAYLLGDPRLFGKRSDGTRHWMATTLLLPYLVFASTVWWLQITLSAEPASHSVNHSLTVSRRLRSDELPTHVVRICDLTCEFVDPISFRTRGSYVCYPILDAGSVSAAELVALARSIPPLPQGSLLIHCANGHGRTGMFAAIWLIVHGFVTSSDDAMRLLQSVRPGIGLRSRQRRVVDEAVAMLRDSVKHAEEPA